MAKFISNRGGFLNVDMMTSIDLQVHEDINGSQSFRAEGSVTVIMNLREIIYTAWRETLPEVDQDVQDRWGHTVQFVMSDIKGVG